jgi:uncharacterized LabA/DUF88 family protein
MNLSQFKIVNLGIDKSKFGKIYSFVDFGNVNYWYEKDERDGDDNTLEKDQKLIVDIVALDKFLRLFSDHTRFYFGIDESNERSLHLIKKARDNFNKTVTKPIQRIKHYLLDNEARGNTRQINHDVNGGYVFIPKCNFDIEITVDAFRYINEFDTFCLLSGDSDFVYLLDFLKRQNKKIILLSAGYVTYQLKQKADLNINAQQIKKDITGIKQKPRR